MPNILDVNPHHLNQLTPEEAVRIFAGLLWASAVRLGFPITEIDIPFNIYAPDGGIDALVETSLTFPENELIVSGGSWYQIKSGTFSINGNSDLKKLLCGKDGALKPRVKACFDNGGCFFAVLFGSDPADPTEAQSAKQAIVDYLAQNFPEYTKPKVRVIKQNQLIGNLQHYPALRNRITGRTINGVPIGSWGGTREIVSRKFESGEQQEQLIAAIRTSLRNNPSTPIRILGDAGCGKTRTVYQAVETEDSHLLCYILRMQKRSQLPLSMRFYFQPTMNKLY